MQKRSENVRSVTAISGEQPPRILKRFLVIAAVNLVGFNYNLNTFSVATQFATRRPVSIFDVSDFPTELNSLPSNT
jgi:hypothetical protein